MYYNSWSYSISDSSDSVTSGIKSGSTTAPTFAPTPFISRALELWRSRGIETWQLELLPTYLDEAVKANPYQNDWNQINWYWRPRYKPKPPPEFFLHRKRKQCPNSLTTASASALQDDPRWQALRHRVFILVFIVVFILVFIVVSLSSLKSRAFAAVLSLR